MRWLVPVKPSSSTETYEQQHHLSFTIGGWVINRGTRWTPLTPWASLTSTLLDKRLVVGSKTGSYRLSIWSYRQL